MYSKNGPEFLSDRETQNLLNEITGVRDKAIVTLLLNTGLRLSEIYLLNINSIDLTNRILHVNGTYKRDIPINDLAYKALTNWSHERIDNTSEALFITLHGKTQRTSARNIDKLIRKYSSAAGIEKNVNTLILRNTFAINLFEKEPSIDAASRILGVSDPEAIRRYIKAAQNKKEGIRETIEIGMRDKRPRIVKRIAKLFMRAPKEAHVLEPATINEEEITVGRDKVISEIKENIAKDVSTLIVGPAGIGKTHILKLIAKERDYIYVDSPTPTKQFILKLCERYCPDWAQRLPLRGRSSAKEIAELLFSVLKTKEKKEILIIDNMNNARVTDIETLLQFFDIFTIISSADETPNRLKEIWWKFRKMDLLPLSTQESKELIRHLTKGLNIVNYALLETKILTTASGFPLSIVEMVRQIHHLDIVKDDDVRTIYHEAGIRYQDSSSIVLIIWTLATSSRFMTLGSQSVEGYILALAGMAALTGAIRFLRGR